MNSEKRNEFYEKLCKIKLNDIDYSDLGAAKMGTSDRLSKLINLCQETVKDRKGSKTIKYLNSIIDSATALKSSVDKLEPKSNISKKGIDNLRNKAWQLHRTLQEVSHAHFPHLVSKSILDHPETREHLGNLVAIIPEFPLIYYIQDNNVKFLIANLEEIVKNKLFDKNHNLDVCLYPNGGNFTIRFEGGGNGIQALILLIKKKIDKFRNYRKPYIELSKKLKEWLSELENLPNIDENSESECPLCGKNYDAKSHKKVLLDCRFGHAVCKSCFLKRLEKNRLVLRHSNVTLSYMYDCPFCHEKHPADQVIYRMKETCPICHKKIDRKTGFICYKGENIVYCMACSPYPEKHKTVLEEFGIQQSQKQKT